MTGSRLPHRFLPLLLAAAALPAGAQAPAIDAETFGGLEAPVLAIFAEHDDFIAVDAIERLRGELRRDGRRATVDVARGVQHGFMNQTRPDRFDANAAASGWERLLAFLRAELA